jgi:hypothetical protein
MLDIPTALPESEAGKHQTTSILAITATLFVVLFLPTSLALTLIAGQGIA